jgi:hypothetical protein
VTKVVGVFGRFVAPLQRAKKSPIYNNIFVTIFVMMLRDADHAAVLTRGRARPKRFHNHIPGKTELHNNNVSPSRPDATPGPHRRNLFTYMSFHSIRSRRR